MYITMNQRILIGFESEELYRLKRVAREQNESVSELVRKAVKIYTKKDKKNPAALLLESVDRLHKDYGHLFKNVDKNLSKKVDEIVYGTK